MRRLVASVLAAGISLLGRRVGAQPAVESPGTSAPIRSRPVARDYPIAPLTAPPAALALPRRAPWAHTTALGVGLGLGAPYGYAGAFLTHHPSRWLELEFGGGYSVPFGPSVGFMARAGLDPGNDSFASIGLGVSANFADYHYVTSCRYVTTTSGSDIESCVPAGARVTADGTAYPLWVSLEVAGDLRSMGNLGARAAAGASVLLNGGAFPDALGCPSGGIGRVPCSAAFAHQDGRIFFLFYAHLDFYFLLYNGIESGRPTPRVP